MITLAPFFCVDDGVIMGAFADKKLPFFHINENEN
jgi:hypothetical protein